ncbi:hypothetical protein ACH5AO_24310 [Streptomyces sp. NPDC018964]|uniref:hypothetical protein n=1 Tax=Streptomyces sp. NPDC018964 TaxID=3365058 RepID=UPI0037B59435
MLLEVEEGAARLGWAFFGPVIGEVVTAAEGFEEGELETVRRFLASVLEVTRRARSA